MKKQYLSPNTEEVVMRQQTTLLTGSYHGPASAPELPTDADEIENSIVNDMLGGLPI